MGAAYGALLGLGLLLCLLALTSPTPAGGTPGRGLHERTVQLLAQAGLPRAALPLVTVAGLLAALIAGGLLAALTGAWPIAAAFAAAGLSAPWVALRAAARRRHHRLRPVWPEVVDSLSSGIRAGMPLAEALAALATRGPQRLRPAFGAFAADYRATGDFEASVLALRDRLADPSADRIIAALLLARQVGGGEIGRLLRALGAYMRADAAARGELEARQSWVINGARVAAGAPWIVLFVLALQPGVLSAYNSLTGALVLAVGAAASLLAYAMMRRIGRLPAEPRVLR